MDRQAKETTLGNCLRGALGLGLVAAVALAATLIPAEALAQRDGCFICPPEEDDCTTIIRSPSDEEYFTLMFEDRWHSRGDFDLNDVIVYVNVVMVEDANGLLALQYAFQVVASGAGSVTSGLALTWQIPADTPVEVEFFPTGDQSVGETPQTFETEDGYLGVIVYPDVKASLGQDGFVNTDPAMPDSGPGELGVLTIRFAGDQQPPALPLPHSGELFESGLPGDIFLLLDNGGEVHGPSYEGTTQAVRDLYGVDDDGSDPESSRFFVTNGVTGPAGLPWRLFTPVCTWWPSERTVATDLFLMLVAWVDFDANFPGEPNPYDSWYLPERPAGEDPAEWLNLAASYQHDPSRGGANLPLGSPSIPGFFQVSNDACDTAPALPEGVLACGTIVCADWTSGQFDDAVIGCADGVGDAALSYDEPIEIQFPGSEGVYTGYSLFYSPNNVQSGDEPPEQRQVAQAHIEYDISGQSLDPATECARISYHLETVPDSVVDRQVHLATSGATPGHPSAATDPPCEYCCPLEAGAEPPFECLVDLPEADGVLTVDDYVGRWHQVGNYDPNHPAMQEPDVADWQAGEIWFDVTDQLGAALDMGHETMSFNLGFTDVGTEAIYELLPHMVACEGIVLDVVERVGTACPDPFDDGPPPPPPLVESLQLEAIDTLREMAPEGGFNVAVRNGEVRALRFDMPATELGLSTDASPEDVARAFLRDWAPDLLRIKAPLATLGLRSLRGSSDTHWQGRFRQYLHGIPVYGTDLVLTVYTPDDDEATVRRLVGRYVPDLSPAKVERNLARATTDLEAAILALVADDGLNADAYAVSFDETPATESVTRVGRRALAFSPGVSEAPTYRVTSGDIWIYDPALLTPECEECAFVPHEPRLSWRVRYTEPSSGSEASAFVDLETGEVVLRLGGIDELEMDIETANGQSSDTCWILTYFEDAWYDEDGLCEFNPLVLCFENACADGFGCGNSPTSDGQNLFRFTRDTARFLFWEYGMDSYDNDDAEYEMYAHVSMDGNNARSVDCGAFRIHEFTDGMVTQNIVAHELGHSVHLSWLNDRPPDGQPRAVSEHFGDALAAFQGFWSTDFPDPDWLIGEGSVGEESCGAMRNLANPPACGDPDHMDDYDYRSLDEDGDYGGVHTNSLILSRAVNLYVDGGTHRGVTVDGVGQEAGRHIFRRTLHNLMTTTHFWEYAWSAQFACWDLVEAGDYGLTAYDCCQVRNAMAAVGTNTSDTDCDGTDDDADNDDDNDGIADDIDPCPLTFSTNRLDTDADGLGDVCDDDDDDDGISDDDDNCPLTANDGQADDDFDGVGNACDDGDYDGVLDLEDNCPDTPNPDQENSDWDSIGDACDDDDDNDGVPDEGGPNQPPDNCRTVANPNQLDSDSDSVGERCDNCPDDSNGTQRDTDNDGDGDACDDDIDNDGEPNESDLCDYEPGDGCLTPPIDGVFGQLGPLVSIGGPIERFYAMSPTEVLLDHSALAGFEAGSWLTGATVEVQLDIGQALTVESGETALTITAYLVDEVGSLVTSGEIQLYSGDTTGSISLSGVAIPAMTTFESRATGSAAERRGSIPPSLSDASAATSVPGMGLVITTEMRGDGILAPNGELSMTALVRLTQ